MTLISNWSFVRASGPSGFLAKQRVSTDALNALTSWCTQGEGRVFKVTNGKESHESLSAELSVASDDFNSGCELDLACLKFGLDRFCLD